MADVDLAGAAAIMRRSYDWMSRHWRRLPGFPRPFVGDYPGGRAWWRAEDIEAWKAGVNAASAPATSGNFAQRCNTGIPANDPVSTRPATAGRVSRLLAAAGG